MEAIAREAGHAILRLYAQDFDVTRKDDDSPLTQADLAAHELIKTGLSRLTPDLPLLSEEGAERPYAERAGWSRYWLVDPLDGTKEFIRKNGEFTVNIALVEQGEPVLGVVYAPVLDQLYAGARGLGAWREDRNGRQPLKTRAWPERPAVVASRSHRDARTDALLERLPAHTLTSVGSSLKFCLVAAGEADLYPRLGPTSEWDTAAAQAVVEAAGGAVLEWPALTPLRYNAKDSLLNPEFLVVGDPTQDWAARLAGA